MELAALIKKDPQVNYLDISSLSLSFLVIAIFFFIFLVIVCPFAGMDMWGMLHTVSRAELIRSTVKTLEEYMGLAYQQSVKHGPQARQFVVLFDMAGFNVKQYTWRPCKYTQSNTKELFTFSLINCCVLQLLKLSFR